MKTIISKYGRSIVATLFLTVMVAGPICAVGGVIVSSLGTNLAGLIATVVLLA